MSELDRDLDYTNEAWWQPPLHEMHEDRAKQLGDLALMEELDDLFYPDPVTPAIKRRFRDFQIDLIASYDAECFGYANLWVLHDRRERQSVTLVESVIDWSLSARLINRRPENIWPSVLAFLIQPGPLDGFITFKDNWKATVDSYPVWDYIIWTSSFWITESIPLRRKLRQLVATIYQTAPEDSLLKEFAPNADAWFKKQELS